MALEKIQSRQPWPPALRVVFRFVCSYWVLYTAGRPLLVTGVPGVGALADAYAGMWRALVPWLAVHIFHVTGRSATYFPTDGGDTTLEYIHLLLYLVLALAAAAVWSVLDRRRAEYGTAHGWLRLLVRYTLALSLFTYGFSKLFLVQFRPPNFSTLIEPYGEFPPSKALWAFMGASAAYTVVGGAAEVSGGLLLLFRRTTMLGALVSAVVMLNVVVMNFCYDFGVKLYSAHVLLMAFFLLAPDFPRLANALVLNRPSPPADLTAPQFVHRTARIGAGAVWALFVAFHLTHAWRSAERNRHFYYVTARPPLYGLYQVENHYRNWRKVAIDRRDSLTVRTTEDAVLHLATEYEGNRVTLDKRDTWTWSRPDSATVVFENGRESILLRRIDPGGFPLLSRRFRWVEEDPPNLSLP